MTTGQQILVTWFYENKSKKYLFVIFHFNSHETMSKLYIIRKYSFHVDFYKQKLLFKIF